MEIETKQRKSPKRLILDLPEDWHYEIKLVAADHNMTIRNWVLRNLMKEVLEHKKRNELENK